MISGLIALRQRSLAALGRLSMYRLVLFALVALALIALLLSGLGVIVSPSPVEILGSFLVLAVVISAVDALSQRLLHLPWRIESSLITALILLFVLRPGISASAVTGLALAGALAALSKYLVAWRGRHILNPAAFGAAVVTVAGSFGALEWLGTSASWWVGTPSLAVPVILLGMLVLWRTERVRVVLLFLVVAIAVSVLRQILQAQQAGFETDFGTALSFAALQSPFLFLGAFMLSEPLTLPPRRWQQFIVAAAVGLLAGWPISIGGLFTLGQDRALLIGNLVAFAFALRSSVRLTLEKRVAITPTVHELTFRANRSLRFLPGQYLELDVPHRGVDARGTRREFSIVSAPADLPEVRIAYKLGDPAHPSSFKRALAEAGAGSALAITGTWGDFVLPKGDEPILMVAAGIGVTPFVSQLRQLRADGAARDVRLVYVASDAEELAFREELAETGVPVVVFTREEPASLPAHWRWGGGRLDAAGLEAAVPDLVSRHAFVSGPPRLIAELAPALRARSVTTDAFAGY